MAHLSGVESVMNLGRFWGCFSLGGSEGSEAMYLSYKRAVGKSRVRTKPYPCIWNAKPTGSWGFRGSVQQMIRAYVRTPARPATNFGPHAPGQANDLGTANPQSIRSTH